MVRSHALYPTELRAQISLPVNDKDVNLRCCFLLLFLWINPKKKNQKERSGGERGIISYIHVLHPLGQRILPLRASAVQICSRQISRTLSSPRTRYPLYSHFICISAYGIGGERGIRTLDGLLTHTPLAGVRLRPLGHLSGVNRPKVVTRSIRRNALGNCKQC
jgi:hypothetical protein